MTPQQQSLLTKQQQAAKEQKHMWCRMEVRKKGPHVGLYCTEHGTWIRWISADQARKIKDIL